MFLFGVIHVCRAIVVLIFVPHKVAESKDVAAQAERVDGSLLDILKVVLLDDGLLSTVGQELVAVEVLEPSIFALNRIQLVLGTLLRQLG